VEQLIVYLHNFIRRSLILKLPIAIILRRVCVVLLSPVGCFSAAEVARRICTMALSGEISCLDVLSA